jgi:hypothetical protein
MIIAAIGVLGCAAFTSSKNGDNAPMWQNVIYFSSLALVAIGIIGVPLSLLWWAISLKPKSKQDTI